MALVSMTGFGRGEGCGVVVLVHHSDRKGEGQDLIDVIIDHGLCQQAFVVVKDLDIALGDQCFVAADLDTVGDQHRRRIAPGLVNR